MMTQSNASRASSISRRMRSEVSPAIGSEIGLPAGSTASRCDTWCSGSGRSSGDDSPSLRPDASSMPNTVCSDGRRRSASMSSTFRWYDSLKRQREVGAVSVLPSPASGAGNHHDLEAARRLVVVERRGQPAVLLARRRHHVARRRRSFCDERARRAVRTATGRAVGRR